MDTFVGFDSAWTDNPKAPGAVCAVTFASGKPVDFYCPKLATFCDALVFIQELHSRSDFTLVALDQPTIVPNIAGMRPVEKVAASLISWLGGGVQPANRGKLGMFCDASPIWKFLKALDVTEQQPEQARVATKGKYLIEVFPALALASIVEDSFGRLKGLHYNPKQRKTFLHADWTAVANAAACEARKMGCDELAHWCLGAASIKEPKKADQDKLDSALCLLIALRWRLCPQEKSMMLGDVLSGYMVLPASVDVRERLTIAACKLSVPVDGLIPQKPGTPQQAGASRVVGAADDIKTMGKFLRSDSVIVLDFWPDTPDAVAKPGETVAESLPRIAISHLRKHGNDSEMLLFIKNRLEVASLGTGIRLGDFEPVGIAGMRFSYVANKGREKVSIMLRPLANEVISMKDKTTLNEKGAKELADDRMTEPGIFIIGDDVIYDGEAEHFGVPSMTKAPPMSEDDTPLGDQ